MDKRNGALHAGNKVWIWTVGAIYIGRVVGVDLSTGRVILEDYAWISDTGIQDDMFKTGKTVEATPRPGVGDIMLGAIVEVGPWPHELITEAVRPE